MSYDNEKGHHPAHVQDDVSEDAIPKLDRETAQVIQAEEDAHLGVKAVEAAEKVYGRYSKWFLFIGCVLASSPASLSRTPGLSPTRLVFYRIGLASYIYSLDSTTTLNYLAFAASAFDKHSLISTIQVAQSVISESSIVSLPPPSRFIYCFVQSLAESPSSPSLPMSRPVQRPTLSSVRTVNPYAEAS